MIGGLALAKLPVVLRCSNRLPMTKNKNTGNSTTPRLNRTPAEARALLNAYYVHVRVAKGGVLSKESTSTAYIEKMAGKENKRKKKKEQKKLRAL